MNENEYVEYMHNNTKYNSFTVWDLNKIIHEGDDRPFMEIVNEHIGVLDAQAKDAHKAYIDDLKKTNPKKAEEEQSLDNLIATFLERDQEFKETQNYDLYIAFWEDTWKNEDMSHFGSYWSFRLAELYIDTGRYDDALDFIRERKVDKPFYIDRANSMEEKVLKLKAKEERKRKA